MSHGSNPPPSTKIKTSIKFDGGFDSEPWLIPATKIKTNSKFIIENLPANFGAFNFRIVLQDFYSNMEQPHLLSVVAVEVDMLICFM